MFRFVALLLCVGAHGQTTTPATTNTTTPGGTVTTTPAYTGTTTPGSTVQVSSTMSQSSVRRLLNGRALSSGFSPADVAAAFCASLADISPSCTGPTATLSSDKWTIQAYLTSTVEKAAGVQAALKARTPAVMATKMIAGFAKFGITATGITMTAPTFVVVAAQPYVASVYPSYATPAFAVSFHFGGTSGSATELDNKTSALLHKATVAAFAAAGIPDAGVNMRSNMGSGSAWGANCTISVVETAVNQTYANLQYLQSTAATNAGVAGTNAAANTFGRLITAELKKEVPAYANTIVVSDFLIYEKPTDASAFGVVVNFTTNWTGVVEAVDYTGVAGRLFNVEDDSEEDAAAAPAASWTLPILGVFGLFSLVTFVGMGVRRKTRSTRQVNYSAMADVEEQPMSPMAAAE